MAEKEKSEKIEFRNISELVFDPENPRLPKKLRTHGTTEADILDWMLEQENIIELMGSIAEKGFFSAEPLLIVKNKKINKYDVMEGNRRLAAVMLLNEPNKATKKSDTIKEIIRQANPNTIEPEVPTILFHDKKELQIFLGYRHITGIKAWNALSKAKYLKNLQSILGFTNKDDEFRHLAKIIGSNVSYVKSLLKGLAIYEVIEDREFFKIPNLDETSVDFGVLYTAVGRENISLFVGIDMNAPNPVSKVKIKELQELTTWMFKSEDGNTRLGESRHIKLLDAILDKKNPEALKIFRSGVSITEAATLTDEPLIAFRKSVRKSKDNLLIAQSQMHRIKEFIDDDLENIEELHSLTKNMKVLIQSKIDQNE
jgi:hypothetical protein